MIKSDNHTRGSQANALNQIRRTNHAYAKRRKGQGDGERSGGGDGWRRETHTLPRDEARRVAKDFLEKYPKAAYWSEVESWRVVKGDVIEFTMRRLPSAD